VELVREELVLEALEYARQELAPFRSEPALGGRIRQLMSVLAYESPLESPVASLFDIAQRQVLADAVSTAILQEKGVVHAESSLVERTMGELLDAQQVLHYCGGDTGYRDYIGETWQW
jgi:hypothetical protein